MQALAEPITDIHGHVERSMPGWLMAHVLESMRQNANMTVRQDFETLVNKASVAHLQQLPRETQMMVARAVERDGYAILKASNQDNVVSLLASVAAMLVTFHNRGVDVEQNSLLVALAFADEALEGDQETGEVGSWGTKHSIVLAAQKMEREARKLGYFLPLILHTTH